MIAAKTGLFDLQVVAGTIESDDDLILGAPVGLAGPDHSVIIEVRASQVTRCRVAGEDGERWDVAIGVEHGRADRSEERL